MGGEGVCAGGGGPELDGTELDGTGFPAPDAWAARRTRRSRRVRPASVLAGAGLAVALTTGGLVLSGVGQASSAAAAGAAGNGRAGSAAQGDGNATITVTGTGTATGTPDTLALQMGVSTKAATATGALDRSSTELGALERVLASAGVPAKDIQTSTVDLQPDYDPSGAVTGYEADDLLDVTLHQLSGAGAVIDAAAHAVGNDVRIDSVSFSLSDTAPLLARARAAAMADAASAARQLAIAGGTTLGPIVSVTDESEQVPPPLGASGSAFAAAGSPAHSAPVPVQSGSQEVTAEVQVVYRLA
jgi:uncharacterized protein YggE